MLTVKNKCCKSVNRNRYGLLNQARVLIYVSQRTKGTLDYIATKTAIKVTALGDTKVAVLDSTIYSAGTILSFP